MVLQIISRYFSVLLNTAQYFLVLLGISLYFSVLLETSQYFSELLSTSRYCSVLFDTSQYYSDLLDTSRDFKVHQDSRYFLVLPYFQELDPSMTNGTLHNYDTLYYSFSRYFLVLHCAWYLMLNLSHFTLAQKYFSHFKYFFC